MTRQILISLTGLFIVSGLLAEVPKYSNEFLSVGVGARAFGMSHSVVASTQDVTAGYWNPAGLMGIERDLDISLMHAEYFAGIAKYDYAGFAIRIDERSVGALSVIRFGVDDIPNTLELMDNNGNIRYDRITTFSAADYGFLFSYARSSKVEGLSFGGNAKLIYRRTGDFANAWGFGFDLGINYNLRRWYFGANARDVTSTFNAWSFNTEDLEEVFLATGNEIPSNSLELTLPRFILGAARSFRLHEKFNLLAELNTDVTFDGKRHVLASTTFLSIDPHLGMEIDYDKLVFLRFGIGNMQLIPDFESQKSFDFQPSLGLGIHWRNFTVDYALTDISDQSIALYSNIFSLKFNFHLKTSGKSN
jgi:hypothetical protein